MTKRHHLIAAVAALALGAFASPAKAVTILSFGQATGAGSPITGTANTSGTTITGTDVPVVITNIAAGTPTPFSAFLDLSASSTPAGATSVLGAIIEHFTGSFSFNSSAAGTGTNYLSGTFQDGAITSEGATAIAIFGPQAVFASDVIGTLGLPRSVTFGLTDVFPAVSLASAPLTGSGETIGSFTASVAGNASANVENVPEGAGSLALVGLGLVGLAVLRRRGPVGAAA